MKQITPKKFSQTSTGKKINCNELSKSSFFKNFLFIQIEL